MTKVAIVTDSLSACLAKGMKNGGGYVVAGNLVLALSKMSDIELTVFTGVGGYFEVENVKTVEMNSSVWDDAFYEKVELFLKQERYDIVLSVNLPRIKRNPLLQCHSYEHRCKTVPYFVRPLKRFFSRKKRANQKDMFSKIDENSKFFAMSNIVKEDYQKHFKLNPDNVFVSYPACKQIFEEYQTVSKKEKLTFGVVANSSLNKGGHWLLFALGIVKILGYDFNLKMVAPKYKKDLLMQGIVKLFGLTNRIEAFSSQVDMLDFYSKIDVLVLPSINEAFGLVVLEAMALGIPCVVSSTAGSAEILDENNGFVFNRKSLKSFVDMLKKVIEIYSNDFEKFEKYSYNAFQTSKKYTWENFALNIINKL